ncbi:peptide chain release factor N(5)-glutamine methyltransferase [Natranaerofaba carboxydovora]|uniref:peptide chain release factor N(5)-glutamine methyltransferase n=1 Tax=Natranaerofaba carboxydovora TaxID=2742683 RepID=UPI001F133FA1|nr:peptide chain release factor N(5)-glutamine methyltransferase [Natranaerofaba carboxydovora]UMZ75127.1 Release factor glutamine methyltransferase [Natranaerofaba carboxydovora]
MSLTIEKARQWAYNYFKEKNKINDIYSEVDYILAYVLNFDRAIIYTYPEYELTNSKAQEFEQLIKKRAEGVPYHYLTGEKEFMGFMFSVDENVLVPRPETELLVEECLKSIDELNEKYSPPLFVLEPFTGSGAIGLSLAMLQDGLKIYASDVSEEVLNVARKNKNKLQLSDEKIVFKKSDIFSSFPQNKGFHLIVANPPYIPTSEMKNLSDEVNKEPKIALDGGEDGLYYYKKIKEEYKKYLTSDGVMLLEIGESQKEQVLELFLEEENTCIIRDLANRPRIIKVKI